MITQAAADQDEGTQWKQIRVYGPGKACSAGAKIVLQRWQSNVDDRSIDKCNAGAEDGCGECGAGMVTTAWLRRSNDPAITGAGKYRRHCRPEFRTLRICRLRCVRWNVRREETTAGLTGCLQKHASRRGSIWFSILKRSDLAAMQCPGRHDPRCARTPQTAVYAEVTPS